MSEFKYTGEELDIFALAGNWKKYWSELVRPYIVGSVLEVGAGIGANARLLAAECAERWLCIEPDADLCERIKNGLSSNIEVFSCVTSQLPKHRLFDSIIYIDVLEHIERDKEELEEAACRLNKGGRIIILSPAHNYLFSPFDKKIGHFRRYNKRMLKEIIPSDLRFVHIKYLDSVGFFASFANRVLLKQSDPKPSQVMFWDGYLVAASRVVDPLIRYCAGKSILAILEKRC